MINADLGELLAPLEKMDRFVLGQLGQSLDGRIATVTGHSHYINGPKDIERLHRVRALADAVVVGANTVELDNPSLTVRKAQGTNPVRVVLDPRGRLAETYSIFTDDEAPTLWMQSIEATAKNEHKKLRDGLQIVPLQEGVKGFPPAAVIDELCNRGLNRILIEGGGLTVSQFLAEDLLDRLHISVAALLIGSGKAGITLPEVQTLDGIRRPKVRHFQRGSDLLFDLDLRSETA